MTFSNIDSLAQGKILQIIFDNEVYTQVSEDIRDFELVEMLKLDAVSPAREYRYLVQSDLGPAGVQFVNPGTTGRAYPTAQQSSLSEITAKLKELDATVELEQNLWHRAMLSGDARYIEPFELAVKAKTSMMKRRLGLALHLDGTGILGVISTVSNSSSTCTVTLNAASTSTATIGHAGAFEIGDKIIHKAAAGTTGSTVTLGSGTFSYWVVTDVDRDAQTVSLQTRDTTDTAQTISSFAPAAGEYLALSAQPTFVNSGSISDYGTATEVMAGLETFGNDDGRTIFGVAHSGALKASRYSGSGNPVDSRMFQRALSRAKNNTGHRYRYKQGLLAPETLDALIDSRETDKRFVAVADAKGTRGMEGAFRFLHQNDAIEMVASEFCLPKRVWFLPEAKDGKKLMAYVGSSIEPVKAANGDVFMLKPGSGGGYVNMMTGFMEASGAFVCKHPRGLAVVHNFTNT